MLSHRLARWGAAGAILLLAACASTRHPPAWDAQTMRSVAEAAGEGERLTTDETRLFEAGLAHALPHSPVFDPDRARERFTRLVELHPRSHHRPIISFLLPLLDELQQLEAESAAQRQEVERLREEREALRERVQAEERIARETMSRNEALQTEADRLQVRLNRSEQQLREMREILEGLVDIDLRPQTVPTDPDTTSRTPPRS